MRRTGRPENAPSARSIRRSQPFAAASARASLGVGRGERGRRPQPLALGRSAVELPGERRQRPPARPARHLGRIEARADFVPERTRLAGSPVVGGGLAGERQPAPGSRAGCVEQVAVAGERIGPDEAEVATCGLERGAFLVRKERRLARPAREGAFFETHDEDGLESPRPRAEQVEDDHAARVARARNPNRGTVERRNEGLLAETSAQGLPALELLDQPLDRIP